MKNEKEDFIEAVKTGGQTLEDAEVGHRITSVCLLGHIAIQLGQKLKWDPEGEQFLNNDSANRLLSSPMREPWGVLKAQLCSPQPLGKEGKPRQSRWVLSGLTPSSG